MPRKKKRESAWKRKYRDPRWQKVRLRIFERDGWACRRCGSTHLELQVHHWLYRGDPWKTPDKFLWATCQPCHDILDDYRKSATVATARILSSARPEVFRERGLRRVVSDREYLGWLEFVRRSDIHKEPDEPTVGDVLEMFGATVEGMRGDD